ncbi:MAG: LacI family DNA-binding transcriptional regulator [Chloroflexi bacterium]|nr:LacI family DNA-binding transcriptional regulator [Chloroflexota bacterium]
MATRKRVLRAAHELGYMPHAAARSLKLQRTNTVGLMIADIVNPFYSYLASGVLTCAKRLGYHVILCATDEDPATEREYLDVLMQERVDGIVAVPTGQNLSQWRHALELGTRVVLVDRELSGISTDVVLVDNVKGAFAAVSYLIELGHRRIGILNGPITTTTGKGRLQGYYDALAAANIPTDPELVQIHSFKREAAYDAIQKLFSLQRPPTAIFATNNVLGEAAMFALRERELRIPEDVSLILFDDVPWARLTTPQVTVVSQPAYDLGFIGLERLAQRLQETEGPKLRPVKIELQPELIVRQSCALAKQ